MNRFSLTVGATLILASSAMAQGESDSLPKRQGYRNGSPVTKDTPPPNKKPPNVHEVREAAGYDPTTSSNPIATSSDLPICCGIPVLVLITSPIWIPFILGWSAVFIGLTQGKDEYLTLERIRILEEKARKGDLVAFQQWKEATGRVGSKDIEYTVFMMW